MSVSVRASGEGIIIFESEVRFDWNIIAGVGSEGEWLHNCEAPLKRVRAQAGVYVMAACGIV